MEMADISYALIAICAIFLVCFAISARRNARRDVRGNEASYAVTFGVLFTFVGVCFSLYQFDSSTQEAILRSIPIFLDGMKVAFVTSVLGMIVSLFIKGRIYRRVSTEEDRAEKQLLSSVNVLPEMRALAEAQSTHLADIHQDFKAVDVVGIRYSIDQMTEAVRQSSGTELANCIRTLTNTMAPLPVKLDEQSHSFQKLQMTLLDSSNLIQTALTDSSRQMQADMDKLAEKISSGNENMQRILAGMAGDMAAVRTSMQSSAQDASAMLRATQDFHAKQNDFSAQQIDKMAENTAQMAELSAAFDHFLDDMSNKFSDNFINSLRGLIENLNKNLTEQFGENFKRLDAAVEKLNVWQQENKEQIAKLTAEYAYCYQTFQDFVEKIEPVSEGMEKLQQGAESFAHAAEAAVTQNGALAESLAASRATEEGMREALDRVRTAQDSLLETQERNVEATKQAFAALQNTVAETTARLASEREKAQGIIVDGVREMLEEIKKSFAATADAFDDMETATLEQIERLEGERDKRNLALENSAHAFTETMDNAQRQIGAAVDGFGIEWQDKIEEAVESVKESYKNIATQTQKAQEEAVNQLAVALAGIAQKMTEDYGAVGEKIRELNQALKGA